MSQDKFESQRSADRTRASQDKFQRRGATPALQTPPLPAARSSQRCVARVSQPRVHLVCPVDPAAARMNRQVQVGAPVSLWSRTHEAWISTRVVRVASQGVEVEGKRSILPWDSERLRWPGLAPAGEAGAGGAAMTAGAESAVAAGGATAAVARAANNLAGSGLACAAAAAASQRH